MNLKNKVKRIEIIFVCSIATFQCVPEWNPYECCKLSQESLILKCDSVIIQMNPPVHIGSKASIFFQGQDTLRFADFSESFTFPSIVMDLQDTCKGEFDYSRKYSVKMNPRPINIGEYFTFCDSTLVDYELVISGEHLGDSCKLDSVYKSNFSFLKINPIWDQRLAEFFCDSILFKEILFDDAIYSGDSVGFPELKVKVSVRDKVR